MKKLTLTNHIQPNTTMVENEFIDHAMVNANGEFVKVYLFLLRHIHDPAGVPGIPEIADQLNYTEGDVIRALNYWEGQGLISYERQANPSKVQNGPSVIPVHEEESEEKEGIEQSQTAAVSQFDEYRSRKEFQEIIMVAEEYLNRTLSGVDRDILKYLYEDLNMSADLIEYLMEHCIDLGHNSIHYINKVGLSWHERGITTVEEAKANSLVYTKNYYGVMNAFGLKGRAPGNEEAACIRRWYEDYGFTSDLVIEACNRTLAAIHQPSFKYADGILSSWHKANVHSLKDVEALDRLHQERVAAQQTKNHTKVAGGGTKFSNFDERSYDMSELERKLIQN